MKLYLPGWLKVLRSLRLLDPKSTYSKIAKHSDLSNPSAAQTNILSLERDGFIILKRNKRDKRKIEKHLTAKGMKVAIAVDQIYTVISEK